MERHNAESLDDTAKHQEPLLTRRHLDEAKHCIGMDYKRPYKRHGKLFYRPYRNYFYTFENNEIWMALEYHEFAKHSSVAEKDNVKMCTYYLTRKGLDWLGNQINATIYNEEG